MNITYREYTDQDKNTLLELGKKLDEHGRAMDPMQRIKNFPGFAERVLEESLKNVLKYRGKIWLAEDNGKAIGYIVGVIWEQSEMNKLEIGPHTLGEVVDLYIDEGYRSQGLGTKMLSIMQAYFKEKGCDSMWISHFAPNEIAQVAYKKFGFVPRQIGMLKNI